MNQQRDERDSHTLWLDDVEYRTEFGSESTKLEIAAALVSARGFMGMTQSSLAELAGTSQAYIAKLEKGDANPTIGNIGRLFACMWLKPEVRFVAIEPSKSIESVMIEYRGASETSVNFSNLAPPLTPCGSTQLVGWTQANAHSKVEAQ